MKTNELISALKQMRTISERINFCEENNIFVKTCKMGSGGVFHIRQMKSGEKRLQISAGWGRYNYANAAIITNLED